MLVGTESTQGEGHESKACQEAIRPALLGNPQPKILKAQNPNRTVDLQDVSLTHTDINTHDSIWEGRATFPEELSLMGRFRTHHSPLNHKPQIALPVTHSLAY